MSYISNYTTIKHSPIMFIQSPVLVKHRLNSLTFSSDYYNAISQPTISYNQLSYLEAYLTKYVNTPKSVQDLYSSIEVPFIRFFNSNYIDVPECFSINKSIKRNINSTELIKFSNMLMRKGRKIHCLNLLNTSLSNIENSKSLNDTKLNRLSYLLLNENLLNTKSVNLNLNTQSTLYIRSLLLSNMSLLESIFSFYIYKVKKKIYKNTRGKSGKNTFIWKYVPSFKRLKLVMYWLSKDVRSRQGLKYRIRLTNLLTDLIFNYKTTTAYKVKKFSHNYVYKYSKTTLGTTFRTSKK